MQEDGWWRFMMLVESQAKNNQLATCFDLFFTHEEKNQMAQRFHIVEQLLMGELTQREIAQTYQVSLATVTRGSNGLKQLDGEFKQALLQQVLASSE